MSITVYHGSNDIIKNPNCKFGRSSVDFGQGFYVTDIKNQAKDWALRIAANRGGTPYINIYTLDKEALLQNCSYKIFKAYDEEWLNFVVNNRQLKSIDNFDFIEGGVADDRVIDTLRLYMLGLMDLNTALGRLKTHKPNNQICIRNQELLNKFLFYNGAEQVK